MSEEFEEYRKKEKLIMRVIFTGLFILFLIYVVAGYKAGLAILYMSILIILGTILDESAKETQVMKKFLFKMKKKETSTTGSENK